MENYEKAHIGRRAIAWIINMVLLAVVMYPLRALGIRDQISVGIIQVCAVFLCLYLDQSPGKYLLGLKILKHDNSQPSLKERIVRCLPLLFLLATVESVNSVSVRAEGDETSINVLGMGIVLTWFLVFLFYLSNIFTAFFDR